MAAPAPTPEPIDLANPQAVWEAYSGTVVGWTLNVLAAAAILFAGFWFAGKIRKFIRYRIERGGRVDRTVGGFIANVTYYVLIAFILIAVLNRFGVQTTSLVAVLGAATLAIGLALQGTLGNVAAGVMLVLFRPYRIGDYIDVAGLSGTVKDVDIFSTQLITLDQVNVVVPNGLCWAQPIKNYTQNPARRCDLSFNVDSDVDIDRALAIMLGAAGAEARVLDAPEKPWANMVGIGAGSVELQLRAWVRNEDYWPARLAVQRAVKESFDAAGVSFPVPHMVVIQEREVQPTPPPARPAPARKPTKTPA